MRVQPIEWCDGVVAILDQTQLPQRVVVHEYDDWRGWQKRFARCRCAARPR
jgi:methylthioribose-1-phosphate isomerase